LRLFLQNSLSRSKDIFHPRNAPEVKLFTCGPSVYNLPHIGNYRTYLYEDVLQRMLEALGYQVSRMINFTDVEDKAVDEAQSRGLASLSELTIPNEEQFLKDAALLGIKLPQEIPRSSTSVDQAVSLISRLLDQGQAYWHEGDVFFDPLTFEGFGRLYGLDMSRWPKRRVRFRKDTYPGQRWNLGDFILWHGGRPDDSFVWKTEIGYGRPAWNIQDPAMISKHLGYELDICCGGVDNLYRHHDYNIAIMESASKSVLAPYWLHGEHLLVNGVKMSKSKGNIVYPGDLMQKGWSPGFLRFFLLWVHYRSKLNLDAGHVEQAWAIYSRLQGLLQELREAGVDSSKQAERAPAAHCLSTQALVFLADDLDVSSAIQCTIKTLEQLRALQKDGRLSSQDHKAALDGLAELDQVLGCIF
jgi:cysteinyl-tRNA synthetase